MGTTGLPGRHGTGGGEEGVEVLNLGESMDKGPEAVGGSGGEFHVSAEQCGERRSQSGGRGQIVLPFVGPVKGFTLFPVGKWNNGRISTGGVNPVPGK